MSDLPTVYVFGQNKFGQFRETIKNSKFEKLDWNQFGGESLGSNIINFDFNVSVNYSATAIDFKVIISTVDLYKGLFTSEKPNEVLKTFTFDDLVSKICCNSNFCLVLLENGDVFKINIRTFEKEQLNFLNVDNPVVKKSIFVMNNAENKERITDIACGENFHVAVSKFNKIFNIPNLTYQLPRHMKIKKIVCGVEHAILLTMNGDCYTWGVGLRGQLGHGVIANEATPRLVMNGIKIVDIAAGSWHSAAISIFGDLYVWGWNSHGQLGLPVYNNNGASSSSASLRIKNQTVYTHPMLVDIESSDEELHITKVYCGSKHTMIRTSDNRIFLSGSNNFNQLGIEENENIRFHRGKAKREAFIDEFKELVVDFDVSKFTCYASYACTAFIENK